MQEWEGRHPLQVYAKSDEIEFTKSFTVYTQNESKE